jgi:hypothetical protein
VEPLFVWKQLIDLVGEGRIYFRRASEPPVLIAHVGRGGNPTAHTYLAADLARAASRSCGGRYQAAVVALWRAEAVRLRNTIEMAAT